MIPPVPSDDAGAANPAEPASLSSGFGTDLKKRYVVLIGAAYGLLMRLAFGLPLYGDHPGLVGATQAMLLSFVYLVPLLIGALTVYFSGGRRRTLGYAIVAPWLPVLAFVGGTAVLLIEGSICIAMALPLFLGLSSVGGLAMLAVLAIFRPSPSMMGAVLLLPLMLGVWEREQPLPQTLQRSVASVRIEASPGAVWSQIHQADAIRPAELRDGVAYRVGMPYPQSAHTVATPTGRVREVRWDKGIRFDEPILDWQENRYVRWGYSFAPGTIPPEALDEHVVIGGRYFDLVDTSYRLTPDGQATRLDMRVTYRVSTNFNWYANLWSRWLVDDAARTILRFYKRRAEASAVVDG